MPTSCALSLALLLLVPQHTAPDMPARVAALLEDLDDPYLGRVAHIELVALGALSAPTLAQRALDDWRDQAKAVPRLIADPAAARIALLMAVEHAQQLAAKALEDRATGRLRQIVDARLRARRFAEQLAPYVKDAATLCAPLLAGTPETERLRVRVRASQDRSLASLDAALGDGAPLELEVALELVAQRGESATPACGRTLQRLWDARDSFQQLIEGREADGVDAHALHTLLARAVVAVLPQDDRVADACAFLLSTPRDALELVPLLERVATLGPDAASCLPALRGACLADDDRICRLALDTLAHLGPVAVPLLPDLELRAEQAADPESRRLARIAIRRIAHPDDTAGRIGDLLDDLRHPTRCGSARRELSKMGATAAKVLLATLGDTERAAVWPDAIDLLHALAPSERDAIAAVFATAPADFAHATWHRLRIAVDLVVGTDAEAVARAQLRTWAAADAELASRCGALLDRLAALADVGASATDAELAAALATSTPAAGERAGRLLLARAALTPELLAALTAAVARPDPDFDSNEDALQGEGTNRIVAARALLAHTDAPPPAAFTLAMAHGSAGQRIELLRAVETFAWPPAVKVAHVQPMLADDQVDEVRIAALDALRSSVPRRSPWPRTWSSSPGNAGTARSRAPRNGRNAESDTRGDGSRSGRSKPTGVAIAGSSTRRDKVGVDVALLDRLTLALRSHRGWSDSARRATATRVRGARSLVQHVRVQVGSVRPHERPGLGIDADLAEVRLVLQGEEDAAAPRDPGTDIGHTPRRDRRAPERTATPATGSTWCRARPSRVSTPSWSRSSASLARWLSSRSACSHESDPAMTCDICGGKKAKVRRVTQSFGRGRSSFLIEGIPVVRCPDCGESYMTAATLEEIERIRLHWRELSVDKKIPTARFGGAA